MREISFAGKLKTELSKIKPTGCCRIAECYGLLLFGRSFCKEDISIRTGSKETAELYQSLLHLCFSVYTSIESKNGFFTVLVPGDADRERIINYYASGETDWIFNPKFVKRTCCRWAFIRGAFLSCGSMNNPEKNYHLEFAVKDPTLCFAFAAFLELCKHKPKTSVRKSVSALYYNNSEDIEELLGSMGAATFSLEFMEHQVVKDMRNKLNRKNNFETANISKTVNAAVSQNESINYLEKQNLLGLLPEELYEAAMLRKNNPDASLSELCKICDGRISRSGMNHRLKKIIDIAFDEKKKRERKQVIDD